MNYLLFTTTRCPKCPAVKGYIEDNVDFDGEILDETVPHFMDEAKKFGVTAAPQFIVFDDGEEIFRGSDVAEIEQFLEQ
ncbi:MAG: hypothetical protein K9M51_02385 [Candidatus Gracilibacteria bacterium]|nr:hypothetical protein [Candidatus Gracilibacteria bacterium]